MNIIGKLYREEDFWIRPTENIKFIHYRNIFNFSLLNGKKGPFGGILPAINLIL